jgi:hypothetical protein
LRVVDITDEVNNGSDVEMSTTESENVIVDDLHSKKQQPNKCSIKSERVSSKHLGPHHVRT